MRAHSCTRLLVPSHLCHVVIEAITNYREPQPTMEAVYLLMPTSQNVDRIIHDFSNGRKQYAGAHLFFIDGMYVSLSRPSATRLLNDTRSQVWRSSCSRN